jgi:type I restriction enzyme, S subunit
MSWVSSNKNMKYSIARLIEEDKIYIGDGYRAKNSEFGETGIPFLRVSNVSDSGFDFRSTDLFPKEELQKVGNKVSQQGDVVFTSKGTVGRFAYVKPLTQQFVYSPQLCFWRSLDNSFIEPKFLYYWMQSEEFFQQANSVKGQTDMADYVSLSDQRNFYISLPNIAEQQKIVNILSSFDDKIELNQCINQNLENLIHIIFKSWFIDFDPVRARVERRDSGLPAEIADLFPDSFEESVQGKIPKGWKICQIVDTCDAIFSGGTPSTTNPQFWQGDIPWLSSGETGERFIISTKQRITKLGVDNSSTRLALSGSVVIAGAGQGKTRGQTALLMLDTYVNQSVVVLTANKNLITDSFLFFNLARRYDEFRQISDSHSSRGSLTTKLLGQTKIILPPKELVKQFDLFIQPMLEVIKNNLYQTRNLLLIRDKLLPKLMSGT